MGTEMFPDVECSAVPHPPARAGGHAHRGDRAHRAARARCHPPRSRRRTTSKSPATSSAWCPSSYPVDLIHLFTSGPQEAIIQVALKPDAPRGEALRERLRESLRRELPGTQISFEAGDIVSQVMSFGSPTPIEVAVQGISLQDDYALRAEGPGADGRSSAFLRDLQFAQEQNYPTLDINIDRDRAGQFGLTMADVVRSVVPATSSSRFTDPNYWRDPNSGNAFQIQVRAAAEPHAERRAGRRSSGDARRADRSRGSTDIAGLKLGTMPGLIERYNGQHVVSLTANIHGLTLGEAAPRTRTRRVAGGRRAAPGRHGRAARRDPAARADHLRAAHRPAAGGAGDLSAAVGQLPVHAPGAGHRPDHPRGALRRPADAAGHRHHAQRAIVHGRDHGHRDRRGQLDSAGHLRRTRAPRRPAAARSRAARAPAAACAPS